MKLRSLDIVRLPGIQPGFTLSELGPGVNVIVGPNAIGKSSLLRALRAALYPDELRHSSLHIEAAFDDEQTGATLTALRIGPELHWQQAGQRVAPPPLPEQRFLPCYTLRVEDLLDAEHGTDSAIADQLARELAGGYDIQTLRSRAPFGLKASHGRNEARALAEADQALRKRTQEHQALARDEDRLADLRQQKGQARTADHEAELRQRALELLHQRRERRALVQQLQGFPAGMQHLRGDELDTLAELRQQLQAQRDERQRAVDRRAAALTARDNSGLGDADLDDGSLGDRRRTLEDLRQTESRLEQKTTEATEARARLDEAVRELGGMPEQSLKLDPATVATVERRLDEKRGLDATYARLQDEQAQLAAAEDGDGDPEAVRAARRELLYWLAAPQSPPWTAGRILATAALLGAGGAGIGIAGAVLHPGLWALGLPLVWGLNVLVRPGPGAQRRREAEQRFTATGATPPTAWQEPAVQERLSALDGAVVAAEWANRAGERRREVERQLAAREQEVAALAERLRATAADVGHDPQILDASFQRWLRLVANRDQAREHLATVQAEQQRLQQARDRLRNELTALLHPYGEAPETEDSDADTLAARLDRLGERLRQRDQARRDRDQAEHDIARLDEQIDASREQIRRLFERVGLASDDDDGLRRRIERRDEWRELQEQLRDVRSREADREQQLGERQDLVDRADADEESVLRSERDRQREQAARLEELVEEITRIEGEIARADRERALETARGRHQRAEETLRDRLDEALFAEAGQFLLAQVEEEHEQAVQPAALRQARDWFARFTRHQYELVFGSGAPAQFTAHETASGEVRQLTELSSGTRMQLLLAVRVAFARSAEHGASKLPLILDEALTTADPERFRAAAKSLTLLAEDDDRQIFYLTAQPADAGYWAEHDPTVTTIDLAALRGREAAIGDRAVLEPTERSPVPAANGRAPEDYAMALGVPALDPWADPGSVHMFYLLRDDLGLLQRLLELGVDRLGPLESLLASTAVDTVLADNEERGLRARADGARAWNEAWRHGRGRPVDRAALEASGAVSATFVGRVADLNERLGGDGQALIERLAAGDVSRFQTDKREELENWLLDHGYIAQQAPLSAVDIHLRVAAAMRGHLAADADPIDAARQLVASLEGGLTNFANRDTF